MTRPGILPFVLGPSFLTYLPYLTILILFVFVFVLFVRSSCGVELKVDAGGKACLEEGKDKRG